MDSEKTVICVGDIHGYIEKLRSLWSELELVVEPTIFSSATIIFLGDYCDRGSNTRDVISFLLSLPTHYPRQRHVFLAGNHDFAFSAFLLLLPPPSNGTHLKDTWPKFAANEEREGWYKGEKYEEMHVQGRRWAGCIKDRWNVAKGTPYKGSINDAGSTFESYGVQHGSSELMKAVPDEHKKFLADLVWVHEEENVCIDTPEGRKRCKLIAVHAGLEKSKGVEEQMKILKAKDTSIPKVAALSGRRDVWNLPMELNEKPTILVSGHHGKLYIEGLRLIIDEGGGKEDKPIAAIILPSMQLVRSKQ